MLNLGSQQIDHSSIHEESFMRAMTDSIRQEWSPFILFMKNFRSSKNLRVIDPSSKEESALRLKVRSLEEQIEMLQKSNLNIFIPLSEHEAKNTPNF